MRSIPGYSLAVAAIGILITLFLMLSALGMGGNPIFSRGFWLLCLLWAGWPALLAALPRRVSYLLLATSIALIGFFAWRLSFSTDDGGLGMGIAILVGVVLAIYGILVISCRTLFLNDSKS